MTSCYFGSLVKCCHWGHSKRLGLSGWLHARMSRHLTFQWIYPPSATWGTCAGFPWSLENMRTTKGILGPLKGLCTGSWSFHPPLHIYTHICTYICMFQFSSVAQWYLTLWDPMNCSTPGLPVHHQLSESTQTHAHCVGDAIQPSHPLSSPSPPALNLSQHQGLFKWVSSSHQVA